jgi:hypothetical protein
VSAALAGGQQANKTAVRAEISQGDDIAMMIDG